MVQLQATVLTRRKTEDDASTRPNLADAIVVVEELADRYEMSSIRPLLRTCIAATSETDLRVAIFGRFKAGKSSFLIHLLGRPLLPVGVVPVTSIVTEIGYGAAERVVIRFLDGHHCETAVAELGGLRIGNREPEQCETG